MYIVTKKSKIKASIESFFVSYTRYGPDKRASPPFYTRERYNRMITLDPETCTVLEFEKALGTTNWTENRCTECRKDFDELIHIGDEPDYEACYVRVCKGCLVKTAETFK